MKVSACALLRISLHFRKHFYFYFFYINWFCETPRGELVLRRHPVSKNFSYQSIWIGATNQKFRKQMKVFVFNELLLTMMPSLSYLNINVTKMQHLD